MFCAETASFASIPVDHGYMNSELFEDQQTIQSQIDDDSSNDFIYFADHEYAHLSSKDFNDHEYAHFANSDFNDHEYANFTNPTLANEPILHSDIDKVVERKAFVSKRRPVSSSTATKTLVKPKPGDFPTKRVGESLLRLPRKDSATVVSNTPRGVERPDVLVLNENSEQAILTRKDSDHCEFSHVNENSFDPSSCSIREPIKQKAFNTNTASDSLPLNELSLVLTPFPHPIKSQTTPTSDKTQLHCDVKLSSTQREVLSPIDNRNVSFPLNRQLSQNSEGQRDNWINDDTDNASDHIYSMQIPVSHSPDHNYSSHMIKQNRHMATSLELNALPDPINMSQIAAEVASVDAMKESPIGSGASANEDNNLHQRPSKPSSLICEDDKQLMSIIHTVIDNRSTEMAAVSISGSSQNSHQIEDENDDFSHVAILDLHSTALDSSSHMQAPSAKVVCLAAMQDGGGDLKVELNTKPIEIKPVSVAKEMTSQKQSLLGNKEKNIQSVTYWLPSGIANAVVSNAGEDNKGQGDSNINSNISGQPATELCIRFEKDSLIQTNADEDGSSATNRVVDKVLKATKKGKSGKRQQKGRQKQPKTKPKQERRRRGKAVGVDKATAESEGNSSKNEEKSSESKEKSSENEGISSQNKGYSNKNEGKSNGNNGISSKKEGKPIPLAKANLQKPTAKKPTEAQTRSKPEQLSPPLQNCEDPVVIEPLSMNAIINFKTSQFVNDNTCHPTEASQIIGLKALSTNDEQIKHLNINSTEIGSSLTRPNSSHSTEQTKSSNIIHQTSSLSLTSKSDQTHHNTITNSTHGKLENKSLFEKKMDSSSDKLSNSDKNTNSTYQNVLDRINSLISTNKNKVHGPSPAKAEAKEKPVQNIDDVRKRIEALLQQNETHISQTSINAALLPTQNPPKVTLADKIRLAKESLDPASSSNMADVSLPGLDPEVKKQEAVKRIEELIAQNDDYIEHGTAAYREQVEKETEMDNLQTLADVCDFKLGAKGHGRKRSWSFTQGHQPQMSKSIGDLKALSDVQGTLVIQKAEIDSAHDHAYIMPRNNIPVEITPKTHNKLSAAAPRPKKDKRREKNTLKRHELKKAKLACKDDHSYMNIFPPPVKIAPRPGPISPTPPPTEVVPKRPKSPPYVTRKKKVAPLTADEVPHPSSFTNEKKKSRPPKVELPHGRAFDVINIQLQFEPIGDVTDDQIMTSSASSSETVTSSVIRDHTYEEDKVNTQQFSILRDHSYKKLKTGEDGGKKKVKRGNGNNSKKQKGGAVVRSDHTYTPKP